MANSPHRQWIIKQTQADGGIYRFAYTLDTNGKVTQTDVTDPRGTVRRVTFNSEGYPLRKPCTGSVQMD